MAKFLIAKMASLAAILSSAALLSGCETSSEKPVLCKPGVVNERCPKVQKVKRVVDDARKDKGKNKGKGGGNY